MSVVAFNVTEERGFSFDKLMFALLTRANFASTFVGLILMIIIFKIAEAVGSFLSLFIPHATKQDLV